MLLLLKVRVVLENLGPLDLDGDVFRDSRLIPRWESLPLDGSLGFCLHPLFERLSKNARNVLGVRFIV